MQKAKVLAIVAFSIMTFGLCAGSAATASAQGGFLPPSSTVGAALGTGQTSTTGVTLRGTNGTDECKAGSFNALNKDNCHIIYYIVVITNILAGLAGVIIVISIVIAGIQYSTAGSDPQAVAGARRRIQNSIIALLTFIFMYSFLQWLVPGGLL